MTDYYLSYAHIFTGGFNLPPRELDSFSFDPPNENYRPTKFQVEIEKIKADEKLLFKGQVIDIVPTPIGSQSSYGIIFKEKYGNYVYKVQDTQKYALLSPVKVARRNAKYELYAYTQWVQPSTETLLFSEATGLRSEVCIRECLQIIRMPFLNSIVLTKLSVPQISKIFAELFESLAKIHKMGFSHGDIKPSNLMVDETGRAILIDFGISRPRFSHAVIGHGLGPVNRKIYEQFFIHEIRINRQLIDILALLTTMQSMLTKTFGKENIPHKFKVLLDAFEPARTTTCTENSLAPQLVANFLYSTDNNALDALKILQNKISLAFLNQDNLSRVNFGKQSYAFV
jgi:hypothetical protein